MPPGHSRGGPLTTDRPTAENPGEKFTAHGTPIPRQRAPRRADRLFVWAHAYLVVGTRGRCRMVLVVAHKPDFVSGKRQASCREGRYFVLVGTVAGEVAA